MAKVSYADAIAQALFDGAYDDKQVLFLAEGAKDPSPVFGTLPTANGLDPRRRIEMPTAENAILGAAVGLAMNGYRPVVSFHRVEFALLAMEQIVDNLAKLPWISGGRHRCPVLVRLVVGRGWGQGPVHAQSLEAMFAGIPGLSVTMPVTPQDAYSLTRWALLEDGPVIQIESRWCHGLVDEVDPLVTADDQSLVAHGEALTIVASGYAAIEARHAADVLKRLGHAPDLIDLKMLRPLRLRAVFESLRRTGRLLVVDTGHVAGGIGAEVVAQATAECLAVLKAPPRRLGLGADFVPSSRHQVPGLYPTAAEIYRAATGMLPLAGAELLGL